MLAHLSFNSIHRNLGKKKNDFIHCQQIRREGKKINEKLIRVMNYTGGNI